MESAQVARRVASPATTFTRRARPVRAAAPHARQLAGPTAVRPAFAIPVSAAVAAGLSAAALAILAAAGVEAQRRRRETARRRAAGGGRFVPAATGSRRRLYIVYAGEAPQHSPPPPGRPLRIHRQHQRGWQGRAPCVVLEAGANSWSPVWAPVAALLEARGARVLSYDRAGYGRSDPDPAPARGVADAGADLVAALAGAGAGPPYVLVAHSLGAVFVHAALRALPSEDVLGVVYVDAASRSTLRALARFVPRTTPPSWLARLLGALGVLRATAPRVCALYYDAFAAEPGLRAEALATWARGDWLLAYTREWRAALRYAGAPAAGGGAAKSPPRLATMADAALAALPGRRRVSGPRKRPPLGSSTRRNESEREGEGEQRVRRVDRGAGRVAELDAGRAADAAALLAADAAGCGAMDEGPEEETAGWLGRTPISVVVPDVYERVAALQEVGEAQRRVTRYSSDSELFVAANCGHFVQLDRPEVVADAVWSVVERSLSGVSAPLDV